MATKKEIDRQLKIALMEIGEIIPWFDKEVDEWVFSHDLYPVEYGGQTKEEVIKNYPKYLRVFIKHRLANRLSPEIEKKTKGWGGIRSGAGRPKGSKRKDATIVIRLNRNIAHWLKNENNEKALIDLIIGEKILISKKAHKR